MPRGTLDYRPPSDPPHGWRNGDSSLAGGVFAYGVVNVGVMLMYAANMLGPAPFGLIFLFLGVAVVGTVAAFPVLWLLRPAVSWRGALAAAVCFAALAAFNYGCLVAASEAA